LKKIYRVLPLLFVILISYPTNSFAQTEFSGVLQNYNAIQTTPDYELIAARNRLRMNLDKNLSFGSLHIESDFINRYSNSTDVEIQLKKAYFDWYTTNYDIRVGKQDIIWGKSDGGFVNDILTPVDLREFLTQEPSDLRIGVTALNVQRYFGNNSLQFVAAPTIQNDLLPPPDSRWFAAQTIPPAFPINYTEPDRNPTVQDIQLAAKFTWDINSSIDLDLMVYYWAHPMPAYGITVPNQDFNGLPLQQPSIDLTETYRTSPMAGYANSWQVSDTWIVKSEALFVYERLFTFLPVSISRLEEAVDNPLLAFQLLQEFDLRDDGYLLSKPWYQQMIGAQTDIYGATVSLQGYIEVILNYEERVLPQQIFPYATAFAQRTFLRERLQTIIGGRYNFFGDDFWTQIQGIYEVRDGLEVAFGTNLFAGDSSSPFYGHFTFSQYTDNSFLFGRISLYF